MERLRYTFGRLNTTAIGLLLIGLALALLVVPRFMAAPAPAPQPVGAVAGPTVGGPVPNGPQQPVAQPAPRAADPAAGPAVGGPVPNGPAHQQPAPRPAGPDRPPAPPRANWMGHIGSWFVNMFAFTGGMTALASVLLVGLLLWRGSTLRRRETVDHV